MCREYPEVARHLEWLRQAAPAWVTGIGRMRVCRIPDRERGARGVGTGARGTCEDSSRRVWRGTRCATWRTMQLHAEAARIRELAAEFGVRYWGVAKLVKAPDFDSGMRRFESFLPSPICTAMASDVEVEMLQAT